MTDIPDNLLFTKTHEWIAKEGDDTVKVGITSYAADQLGDIVFVELPEVGDNVSAQSDCCVIESVKAAADIYSPVDGEISAVNSELETSPEIINHSSFDNGWLFKIKLSDKSQLETLLDKQEYEDLN
tara:strand:- start:3812 stop:4192 length:381 start_codon:yes stop_codon:yes gene_type:complete